MRYVQGHVILGRMGLNSIAEMDLSPQRSMSKICTRGLPADSDGQYIPETFVAIILDEICQDEEFSTTSFRDETIMWDQIINMSNDLANIGPTMFLY